MPFSEELKKEVRHKSSFRCCRCQSIDVEIHHILPQKNGGSDLIDNAAPLCPNCHTAFGDNSEKRKIIREMRDSWYSRVEIMYQPRDFVLLEDISNKVMDIRSHTLGIEELQASLKRFADKRISEVTVENAINSVSSIVSSVSMPSATKLGESVYANFRCRKCHAQVGLLIGSNACPNCGQLI